MRIKQLNLIHFQSSMVRDLAKVKSFQGYFGVLAGFFIFTQCLFSQDIIGPTAVLAQNHELTLEDYLQEVWKANELLQVQALGAAIVDEQLEAEKAIFDPVFVGQFNAMDEHRPNTAEQRVNLGFADVFNQRNKILESGVEVLTPSGMRLQLGYDLSRMKNNLNTSFFPHGEYLSRVGVTAVQPLLKGGGSVVTMAGIRAAAVNSDIGFQDYRKGMMEILARAEIAYWNLYEAQEKHRITGESLRMANELLKDSRIRLQFGKGTELELMQAEAGVALRDASRYEASSDLSVARSQLLIFLGRKDVGKEIVATDKPIYHPASPKFKELWGKAFDSNPEFVVLRKRIDLDDLKIVLARNAKLPQLDFTVGYAFSGIGSSAGRSFHAAEDQDYPSWTGGLQLRVPIMGDDKAEHELKATQLRKKATELGLSNFTNELENSLRASIYTVESYRQNGDRYLKVIQFNEKVLDTQLA
ncbi:TolC family protein, partial [bacterium]|nr:TolC family protein [bacterium]